jgi:indolepyruvate ferredoxin oxidoreductase
MDRDTAGLIQMGGEGVDWVSHSQFTKVPHVFQNLGDGTYYHSGYLAIRQAIAAGTNITYKILFNDAVAMTGGQPIDGAITVDGIARQVEAEGATQVVVLSDDIAKYDAIHDRFPKGTEFHDRGELDAVQRRLREMKGVTVLVYEQTCAAEKRRRRKKGELVDPARRLFINTQVCEGCGDCTVQSNCVAVLPIETPLGRKRKIDQSSCNKDYSCAQGFCPSFVGVVGGTLKKRPGVLAGPGAARFATLVAKLPRPAPHAWTGPYDLLVTGVGGTGVITVGTVIAMAAHLEGHSASVLDFTGFAQKGGSVLSFVRLAQDKAALNQVRIDAQQADAVLACDIVVAASADALQSVRRGRTRVLANTHEIPVAESLSNPDASLKVDALLEKIAFAAGAGQVETMDAQMLAEDFLGDSIVSNILAMGYAWQRGLVPVGLAAMQRAIELNGVAVESNKAAFALGRLAAAEPVACRELLHEPDPDDERGETIDQLVARSVRFLEAYQGPRYALRYRRLVETVRAREEAIGGAGSTLLLTRAVAEQMRKLMAYKDEYEVARLYTDGTFEKQIAEQFEGDLKLEFYMAPPALVKPKGQGRAAAPKKRRFGAWLLPMLKILARGKALRGTPIDPFGRTEERRLERRLIDDYETRIAELLDGLSAGKLAIATAIANVPGSIRGYGHVKLASFAIARARESELLNRFDPGRYPRPARAAVAGQFGGIPVTSA